MPSGTVTMNSTPRDTPTAILASRATSGSRHEPSRKLTSRLLRSAGVRRTLASPARGRGAANPPKPARTLSGACGCSTGILILDPTEGKSDRFHPHDARSFQPAKADLLKD